MSAPAVAPRRLVLPAVFALLFLPAALAIVGAVSFNLRNRNNGTLVSSGETREYLLHVPTNHDRSKPTALVISMHGGALWPATHMETSEWSRVADREGFIVVYPSGRGLSRQKVWQAGQGASISKDVIFIRDLIDALGAEYNIDPARIYADGLSNGGGMAFLLACALSDRIAAVGMVAPAVFLPWERCAGARPVPMIVFHGTADRFTPYHGGASWVARNHVFPDIGSWTVTWAARNRCGAKATETVVAADVTRTAYGQCEQGASVELYSIHHGGHTWPGGGPLPEWFVGTTTRSIDASSLMWKFFQAHSMPR
jgi:polyhydroxybutyrate depolymerase